MKLSTVTYIAGFILIGLLILIMFDSLNFNNPYFWNGYNVITNSDSSLLYQISKEFINHPASLHDWDFGTCFYIFPNLLIMMLGTLLFSNPSIVVFFSAIVIFTLQLFLVNLLFKKILPNISKYSLIITNFAILLFLINTIKNNEFGLLTANLFLPLHSGAFINMLIATILTVIFLKTNKWKYLVIAAILIVLSIISDFIFYIYFIVPVFVTIITLVSFRKIDYKNKNLILLFATIIVFGAIGYWVQRIIAIRISGIMPLRNMSDNIINSFHGIINDIPHLAMANKITITISLLTICCFIISIYILIINLFKPKKQDTNWIFISYLIFFVCFFIVSFLAPVINGIYLGIDCVRYFLPVIYLALFNTGLLIDYLLRNSLKKEIYIGVIAISILLVSGIYIISNFHENNPKRAISKIYNYYPTCVSAVDKLSKQYNVKNGIGNYWDARFLTLFSKEKVIVNALGHGFNPSKFANNTHSFYFQNYNDSSKMIYNFIVIQNLNDTTSIYNTFDKNLIKKVEIDGFKFYLLPDFIVNKDYTGFELLKKSNNE